LEELDESGRVRVLLDILGRRVTISNEANNILPMSQISGDAAEAKRRSLLLLLFAANYQPSPSGFRRKSWAAGDLTNKE